MSDATLIRKLYARVGLTVRTSKYRDDLVPKTTYSFDPKRQQVRIWSIESAGLQLHELCHYIVARPEDRLLPNYGLGESVEEHDNMIFGRGWSDNKREYPLTTEYELEHAERWASGLNMFLAHQYFGEDAAHKVADELACTTKNMRGLHTLFRQWGIIDGKKCWTGRIRR